MILAQAASNETLWWIAVIAGFVVVLAVAALLTILVKLVGTIDERVVAIKETLARAEANTADAELLDTTSAGVEMVLEEGLEHHLFLGRVLRKVRS